MGLNLHHIMPVNNPTFANKCLIHVNTKITTLYPSLTTYFHVLMVKKRALAFLDLILNPNKESSSAAREHKFI